MPSLIVLHGISLPPGCFATGAVDGLFTNRLEGATDPQLQAVAALRVSAHLFIDRRGEVVQYVPLTRRAWHAGVSSHFGRPACNDFSIGIELEGTDHLPYEDAQYGALTGVLRALFAAWPHTLGPRRLAGHSDIAPGRKTDPGPAFDWPRLHRLLQDASSRPSGPPPTGESACS